MSNADTWSDDALDRLTEDIGRKLKSRRQALAASEGSITLKVTPAGQGFHIILTLNT